LISFMCEDGGGERHDATVAPVAVTPPTVLQSI
jgi:hypothetical protein